MKRLHRQRTRFLAVGFFMVLGSAVASAQATIGDCEKIQAADAYNQCLAKFGPAQKAQNLEPERPSDVKDNSAEAAASAGGHRAALSRGNRGRHHARATRTRSGGRKRLVISVGRRHHR